VQAITLQQDFRIDILGIPKRFIEQQVYSVSCGDALERCVVFSICLPDLAPICVSSTATIGRGAAIGLTLL
jgi:hypothetical protein